MNINKKDDKYQGKASFFPLLVVAIAISIILSYLTLSPSGSSFLQNAGLGANISAVFDQVATEEGSAVNQGSVEKERNLIAQNRASQGTARLTNPLGTNGTLVGFLNKVLDVLIMLGSIVVVFMIILAGLRYVLARGSDSEIQKAHTQLTWTAIGAAILLGAKVISMVIANTVRSLSQ